MSVVLHPATVPHQVVDFDDHFGTKGGRHPPQAPDVYVSSNVGTLLKEPQYCIMYASGQQPGRAGGPGKSPGPPNGSPKGERTTGRGMSAG